MIMRSNRNTSENFWTTRRVFVTGGTGFVGSWLVNELLGLGAEIVVLVRDQDPQSEFFRSGDYRKVKVVNGCLEDYPTVCRALSENNIDVVFHLAAQALVGVAYRNPLLTFESNIRGTYNLLEACRIYSDSVKRIVIASSDKAYGEQPVLPYTEEMALQGQFPYDVSKLCADHIARGYFYTYGLPVAIARCGNIYGGGDLNWSRLIPGTILALLKKTPPVIRSDGSYLRDYVYVEDVIQFYLLLGENLGRPEIKGQAFNFSAGKPFSVLEIVQTLRGLMNETDVSPIIENSSKAEIHSQYLSCEKSKQELHWMPKYTLSSGLEETIRWYKGFLGGQ